MEKMTIQIIGLSENKEKFSKDEDLNIISIPFSVDEFYQSALEERPQVLFIFSKKENEKLNLLLAELCVLKKFPEFQSFRVVLINDLFENTLFPFYFHSGVNELVQLSLPGKDLAIEFCINHRNKKYVPQNYHLEKIQSLNRPLKDEIAASFPCLLSFFGRKEIIVEGLPIKEKLNDVCNLKFPIFPDLDDRVYPVQSTLNHALISAQNQAQVLSIPYPGPWDKSRGNELYPNTVETWLHFNKEKYVPSKKVILLISDRPANSAYLNELRIKFKFHLLSLSAFNKETAQIIKTILPSLVLLETTNLNTTEASYLLLDVINHIKEGSDYSPFFIMLNHPSKSPALQKLFQYPSLLATSEALNFKIFAGMLQLCETKFTNYQISPLIHGLFFLLEEPTSQILYKTNIKIISLDSYSVNFQIKQELSIGFIFFLENLTNIPWLISSVENQNGVFNVTATSMALSEAEKAKVINFIKETNSK